MLGLFKSKGKTKQARILLVDDEPDLQTTTKMRLESRKCQVFLASNGREGLDMAVKEHPDLILLDTNMPEMNGHEMLDRLRKHPDTKDIPVIMLTAICDPSDVKKASSLGIIDYVTKPFNFAMLIDKIARTLPDKSFD